MGLAAFNRLRRIQQVEQMKPENIQIKEIKEEVKKPIEETTEIKSTAGLVKSVEEPKEVKETTTRRRHRT